MMRKQGVFPNKHTFPLLLKSDSRMSFQIFSEAIKLGFEFDHFFRNSLLASFANHGFLKYARQVFDEMLKKDIVAYTALMDCYIKNSQPLEAKEIFLEMRRSGSPVDEVAIVSSLCAAGASGYLQFGRCIHGFYIEPRRVPYDVYVGSALVDMYSKCGSCDEALKAFLDIPNRNIVSWSALLSGYVQCHRFQDVIFLFQNMLHEKSKPNEAVLATILTACAQLGALAQGMWIHRYIGLHNLQINSILGTALIDMYAKCGCIREAKLVFDEMRIKDVYPWTALIFGLAMNGDATGSLNLFQKMLTNGVKPNEVTFIAVLSACSHGGYVTEGQQIFASMESDHGVKPTADHYGCIVDLLGRAGKLREALKLIRDMPMALNSGIWGSLFRSCMIHKDLELGKIIGNHMIELQPENSGVYTLLVNVYSKNGRWEAASEIRRKMRESGVWKIPGCSWIDVNGLVHEFAATENSHLEKDRVYGVLNNLTAHMMQVPCAVEIVI